MFSLAIVSFSCCFKSSYQVTVPENTGVNLGILTVTAQDPDLGTNGQISYSITSTKCFMFYYPFEKKELWKNK